MSHSREFVMKSLLHHLHHPPVYFVTSTLLGICLKSLPPDSLEFPVWVRLASIVPGAFGLCLGAVSVYFFLHWHTGIIPFSSTTHIVKNGFYRFTRNPMYLGLLNLQISLFLLLGNPLSLVMTPIFWHILHFQFVLKEEKLLLEQFGEEYEHLLRQTRRWV